MNKKFSHQNRSKIAEKRGNIYAFLSMIYAKEPTMELLDRVQEKELASLLKEMGVVFDKCFETLKKEDLLEELICEYTRIYIGTGPKHIPPYESVYTDTWEIAGKKVTGLMWGESTVAVRDEYYRHGYQPLPFFKDIPDHIGVELGLMRLLSQEEKEAWQKGDKETALKKLEAQKKFLEEHLVQWVPTFCDQAADFAQLEFYASLAKLTKDFILSEQEQMEEITKAVQES